MRRRILGIAVFHMIISVAVYGQDSVRAPLSTPVAPPAFETGVSAPTAKSDSIPEKKDYFRIEWRAPETGARQSVPKQSMFPQFSVPSFLSQSTKVPESVAENKSAAKVQFGLGWNWGLVTAPQGGSMSVYSIDMFIADLHRVSLSVGHPMNIGHDYYKYRVSYQLWIGGHGVPRFMCGAEIGFGNGIDRIQLQNSYGTWSKQINTTIIGPLIGFGLKFKHGYIEIKEIVTFIPDINNEISLGGGILF